MTTPLYELSALQLLEHYRDRALSPVEVTQAVLARIERWEPHIHATYGLDAEAALASARASEARWAQGKPQGDLDGVPVTLKENIATRGTPTPIGSAATVLAPAAADAPAAARLREAGAVIVTKTTMPDFGFLGAAPSSFHALTRNPWDLGRNTGGSSSGAGAAAAAGYGPLHLGTDIGGSVRIPASFCGVFGLKPSHGRIPVDPPAAARVIGPMTRTVADAALLMQVVTRPDARDYMSLPPNDFAWQRLERNVKGLRIGLWTETMGGWPIDAEVKEAVLAAARLFEQAGAIVEPLADWSTLDMRMGMGHFFTMRCRVDLAAMPPERAKLAAGYIHQAAEFAASLTPEDTFRAFTRMQALRAATVAATQPFDYVLSPVSPVLPFAADAINSGSENLLKDSHFTSVFNQSEQPAASINCGHAKNGLPIGLQIAGRRFDDLGVLQMARFYESVRPAQARWPEPA
ncbi:aspartyl-tRNA(Asn)/glutamyl-tRNA(Gln) amidotransferase subunit A [Variovorax boronicumulans]|uniref:amidase n=1 Tax=Variovorax boronicumulans TaxID=436515 RepID=UPI00277E6ECC|nr:amidase [Variovorax boronicumulans]MDP9910388.1 aspartyl-tRNA(Asn)/glutamyl-tRNA(Gln) amidotransferase subunit A [Variovorax boronicumulans]